MSERTYKVSLFQDGQGRSFDKVERSSCTAIQNLMVNKYHKPLDSVGAFISDGNAVIVDFNKFDFVVISEEDNA